MDQQADHRTPRDHASEVPTSKPIPYPKPKEDHTESIRTRAYEIYVGRGKRHGFDVDDWLDAEKELASKVIAGAGAVAV